MRRFAALALALGLAGSLTACGMRPADPDTAQESIQVIAMDTVMIFKVYGEKSTHAAYLAEDEVRRLEGLLSRTDADSQISALNNAGGQPVTVDGEVLRLLDTAGLYSEATGGAFDVSVAPVVSAWGFTEDSCRVPAQAELEELLTHVGMEHVYAQSGDSAWLDEGTQIDLGGIAKGYATDRIAEILKENGIPRATISLGGNVLAWGDRPDGEPWLVGIQDPGRPDEEAYVGGLRLEDGLAVTSGGYQRYFEQDGKTYHHIIDPSDGYPADSGLVSVTVVADCSRESADGLPGKGTMCDALSTALFVMGEEKALDFWRNSGYDFDLVLVTEDGRVVVTDGVADRFTFDETGGYSYETVS